ncbi:hypothetical protein [Pontivivens ytuae]|uniref:hypothetical protein n=1 Tax=Pontivivens ytuae TaxID=2789856 RepID=UPI001E2CA877|nr:hypothetical protein [Pontivivens ytuae]
MQQLLRAVEPPRDDEGIGAVAGRTAEGAAEFLRRLAPDRGEVGDPDRAVEMPVDIGAEAGERAGLDLLRDTAQAGAARAEADGDEICEGRGGDRVARLQFGEAGELQRAGRLVEYDHLLMELPRPSRDHGQPRARPAEACREARRDRDQIARLRCDFGHADRSQRQGHHMSNLGGHEHVSRRKQRHRPRSVVK